MADKKTVWDFVESHYPDYYSSDEITLADDLQKIMDNEIEPNSAAEDYFIEYCDEDINIAKEHYYKVHFNIFYKTIENFLKTINR
jgi:hypothetical protein